METDFPDSPAGRPFLRRLLPEAAARGASPSTSTAHALRREIIATAAVNHIVNNAGVTFLWRVMNEGKTGISEAATAYLDVERESGALPLREDLLASAGKAAEEHAALLEIEDALEVSVLAALEGKKKVEAGKSLKAIRSKLKL